MSVAPLFLGNVDAVGKLRIDEPYRFRKHLRAFVGKPVEVVVRKRRSKRSLEQNAFWWAVPVAIMAEFMGDDPEPTHYALLGECFGYHWNERLKREVPNKASSSRLTAEEFSQLIEWCPRWALEQFGVVIPLPNEADWEGEAPA